MEKTQNDNTQNGHEQISGFEEKEIKVGDVIDSLSGVDEDGDPKSVTNVSLIEIIGENRNEVTYFTALDTYISKISFVSDFMMIEFEFGSIKNVWLLRMMEILDQYHSIVDKSNYALVMTITNLVGECPYFMAVNFPLAYVQGFSKETGKPTAVQVIFPTDAVNILESTFDIESIKAEVARDAEEEERYLAQLEEDERSQMNVEIAEEMNAGNLLEDPFVKIGNKADALNDPNIRNAEEE